MKPVEYRRQFDIPRTQPLAARSYSESRRQMAIERGLGENLAKARAARGKSEKEKSKICRKKANKGMSKKERPFGRAFLPWLAADEADAASIFLEQLPEGEPGLLFAPPPFPADQPKAVFWSDGS